MQLGVEAQVFEARHYRSDPPGRVTCNNKYSKKAIMWLLHMEQNDGVVKSMHATDANADCLNCLTSVLMVILQRRIHFMRIWLPLARIPLSKFS